MGTASSAANGSLSRNRVFAMLVRREFWEHPTLTLVPLIVLGMLLLVGVLGLFKPGMTLDALSPFLTKSGGSVVWTHDGSMSGQGLRAESLHALFTSIRQMDAATHGRALAYLMVIPFRVGLVLGCLALFLMLGRIFEQELRDRSSHFFKSMPISSAKAIGAKLYAFGQGLLLLLAALLTAQVLVLIVYSLTASALGHSALELWRPLHLGTIAGHLLLQTFVDLLWWLPAVGAMILRWNLGSPDTSAQKRLSICLLVGSFSAVLLDRLYLSGGGLWDWLKLHFMPPGWNWSTTLLESTARQLDRAPGTGTSLDLWTGVLLGVSLLWLATKARDRREE